MQFPQNYNPKESEPKWQKYWADNDIYAYQENNSKPSFKIDTPPPTVSGKMHLGHAFSYTQQDIIARFKRMQGNNVFFPFGTDDNGLPTERLIEKSKNINANQVPREQFINICNEVIQQEKPKFIQSWKDIGMSADFKRSYSTINKHCQITSQASFIDLYHKGRIYSQESPVAWCVLCQTAIAQAEFENTDLPSNFNDITFSCGVEKLTISTTRPELLPACVALCHHPEDQRYTHLKGKHAQVPIFNYEVPIIQDESVDLKKGTGLMMVCTFGDKEDVEKWHKHKLPLRIIFEKYGKMNELAGEFKGLKIKDARTKITERLKEQGHLLKQTSITHAVNVHERCKTEIEFLKTKQWYIKILDKKRELLHLGSQLEWHPNHMKVRYDHWVENLGWDWCISRQRPFGIPIPIWYCTECKNVTIPELSELPTDPTINHPKQPCSCGSTKFIPEKDVLDTWATSSMTPEIASNWVDQGEYNINHENTPFDLRPQAHDIIRTWLFYTIVKSYLHFGRLPWKKVMISGHAQDSQGRKMSKSIGNIIEPQDMIQKYSADALRFWAAGSTLGDDLPFQEKDLLTGQKFATKLWNATKFTVQHLEDYNINTESLKIESLNTESSFTQLNSNSSTTTETFDSWLLTKLNEMIEKSSAHYEKFEYAKAKTEIEMFFWHVLCDNYLEIVKDRLYNPQTRGESARKSAQYALNHAILGVLKTIAPIMPHITEEIYQTQYAKTEHHKSIHLSSYPNVNNTEINKENAKMGDTAVDIITTIRKYKSENKWSMKEPISEIIIHLQPEQNQQLFKTLEADLIAVTGAKKISYTGLKTHITEQFKIEIGIVK